jgi:hypothetical protein
MIELLKLYAITSPIYAIIIILIAYFQKKCYKKKLVGYEDLIRELSRQLNGKPVVEEFFNQNGRLV